MSRGTKSLWRLVDNLPCDWREKKWPHPFDGTQWAFYEWGMKCSYVVFQYNIVSCMTEKAVLTLEEGDRRRVSYFVAPDKREEMERLVWSIYNEFGYGYALLYFLKNDVYLDGFGGTRLIKDLEKDRTALRPVISGHRDIEDVFHWVYYENYFEGADDDIAKYIASERLVYITEAKRMNEKYYAGVRATRQKEINQRRFASRSATILGKMHKIKSALSSP